MTLEVGGDVAEPEPPYDPRAPLPTPTSIVDDPEPVAKRGPGRPSNAAKLAARNAPTFARRLEEQDGESIGDWLQSLTGDGEVRVAVTRKRPLVGPQGENIAGHLETIEERIDEEYIKENWGGGTFTLSILTPRANGQWKILTSRQIKLAGPPKMNGRSLGGEGTNVAAVPEGDSLAERAFVTMERNAREERLRADRIEERAQRNEGNNGLDIAALQALNAPLLEQLRSAQDTIANLQQQMIAISTKAPPRDEFRDRLMERAIEGESSRIEKLKEAHEARLDKLRDNFDDERKRTEDRHQDEIKRIESRHERELNLAAKTVEGQNANSKTAFDARLDALKDNNARLERELTAAMTKIAALEARKDQSIGDKADEILKVKEALDGLGGDDKDEAWYEKLINAVGNSEAAVGFINKLSGGAPQQQIQQQPQQNQLPPPGVPFQTGDGNVYVRDAHGNTQVIDQASLQRQRKVQAARARKKAAVANGQPDIGGEVPEDEIEEAPQVRPPAAKDIRIAITFMESAVRSNATPEAFSQSARSLVSGDVLEWIGQVGIDNVLNQHAKLEQNSPLRTVRGRQFARAVAQILLQGERDPEPAPEATEPPE